MINKSYLSIHLLTMRLITINANRIWCVRKGWRLSTLAIRAVNHVRWFNLPTRVLDLPCSLNKILLLYSELEYLNGMSSQTPHSILQGKPHYNKIDLFGGQNVEKNVNILKKVFPMIEQRKSNRWPIWRRSQAITLKGSKYTNVT